MIEAKRLIACVLFLLGGLWVRAAEPDTETATWWTKQVPSSGFVPADENPDFDKYMAISAPVRKGKDGKFVTDEIAAKGWDKTLKTFYMTLEVKPESPIRVGIPEIPSTLPARAMTAKDERIASQLHSDCKVLGIADGKVLEVTGKVGLAVSMGTMGYIVGLPGSRLDISVFTNKPFPLAGRQWRAKSAQRAYMLVTSAQILLVGVEEVEASAQADSAVTAGAGATGTSGNCRITSAKATSLDARAIGYGGKTARVLVVEVTVDVAADQPSTLRWKQAVPVLKTPGKDIKASRLLIPNWLPMAGGVGPYATEMGVGGERIGEWLKVDEKTWGGWLAIDKPGSTTGDHISIPIESVTVEVRKEKPVHFKLLFAADPPPTNATLNVPGCSPPSFRVVGPSDLKDMRGSARTLAVPPERQMQEMIADACLADRPSLQGYTGIVKVKEAKLDPSHPGKIIVYADVAFVYFGTRLTLGYVDHFILFKNAEDKWNVEIIKKEPK